MDKYDIETLEVTTVLSPLPISSVVALSLSDNFPVK